MRTISFPPHSSADEDGLIAIGGDLKVDMLLVAYSQGIFPWPISPEFPLAWFSPDPRGILEFKDWHEPSSFKKWLKKTTLTTTMNQAFHDVIRNCAEVPRKNQPSTWITPDIIQGYVDLFKAGFAYSVEVWDEKKLVGGLYGVKIKHFISGESMFSLTDNASKLALRSLIQELAHENIQWMDTQMVTPLLERFGGKNISRAEFLKKLNHCFS
jgi:leucyl/phenylalanyl-tRNA---protein transferase